LIVRRVTELSLTPAMNVMDGFLTTHLERTFYKHEAQLIREYLGAPEDIIECPTESQRKLFGPTRRRVPKMIDLTNPVLLGPGAEPGALHAGRGRAPRQLRRADSRFLRRRLQSLCRADGRYYGLVSQYMCDDAETVFVSLGSAAENIEAAVDYLRQRENASVGSIHINVFRPFPEAAVVKALAGKKNVIILERTDEPMAGDNPMGRDIRTGAQQGAAGCRRDTEDQRGTDAAAVRGRLRPGLSRFQTGAHHRRLRVRDGPPRPEGRQARVRRRVVHRARHRSSL
jgi:pyruvate-ferredoxin/flavodoxin oxidoreductase